ncbi:RIKEN cDNA 1700025G04, isoform CRA_b, partial [Mus musculus]
DQTRGRGQIHEKWGRRGAENSSQKPRKPDPSLSELSSDGQLGTLGTLKERQEQQGQVVTLWKPKGRPTCTVQVEEKSASSNTRLKTNKEIPGLVHQPRANMHISESQQEFFRMLDEKIEKGRDYCSEEEDIT